MKEKGDEKVPFIKPVYAFLKKHWILNTVILFIPSLWVPVVVNIFGTSLGLSDPTSQSRMSKYGIAITIFLYALVLLFLVMNNRTAFSEEREILQDNKNNEFELNDVKDSYDQLEKLLSCIRDICVSKYDTLIDSADKVTDSLYCCSDPPKQINTILLKLIECLERLSGIKRKQINATLAYKLGEGRWRWVEHSKLDGGLNLNQLSTNPSTTFNHIVSGNRDFIFYNCKKLAEEAGMYVRDTRDMSNENKGSIICRAIRVGTPEVTYAMAILSISTYGKKFVEDDNCDQIKITEANIKDLILPEFETRLQIELAQLYLKEKVNIQLGSINSGEAS